MVDCYVGIGGNRVQTFSSIKRAIDMLLSVEGISNFKTSSLYQSTPVSPIAQPPYLNAVVKFSYQLTLKELWKNLQKIEQKLGKVPKPKNASRLIDLDLLFFGPTIYYSAMLVLPHPKWHERLFVLKPLSDVTKEVPLGLDVEEMLEKFSNPHNEQVVRCTQLI